MNSRSFYLTGAKKKTSNWSMSRLSRLLKLCQVTEKSFKNMVFTRKSVSLKLESPICREIFNKRIPRMSATFFSLETGCLFVKQYLKMALIWELHKKKSIIQLIQLAVLFFFYKQWCFTHKTLYSFVIITVLIV